MVETIVLRYRTFIIYVFLTNLALNFAEVLRGNNWSKKHIVFSANNVATIYNVTRNASGYITRVNGIAEEMMAWFSKRYDLTYSALQTNETGLDSSGDKIGLIGHLLKDECQILFSVAVTKSRIELVSFSQPHSYIPISYLILKPDSSPNIAAIVASFQTSVWICVIISIPFICFSFYSFHRFIIITYDVEYLKHEKKQSSHFNSFYVLGLLFNQGGYLQLKSIPYNLVGVVWCIATFVLVNAYTTTLISHVALPNQKPLINSIYELRDRSDVYLVTEKNLNTDAFLMSAESGLTKMLGDKLRSYPNSRCKNSKGCITLLKSGQHVYTSGVKPFLYNAMLEDYQTTGQCHYILQKHSYLNLQLSAALPKQSRLMNDINLGILQLREAGLEDEWSKRMEIKNDPRECTFFKTERKVKSLTFNGLSGVFVVLAFGIASSTLAFIGEQIVYRKYSTRGKQLSVSSRM